MRGSLKSSLSDLKKAEQYIKRLEERVRHMLKTLGDQSYCDSCQAPIVWCVTKAGSKMPYNTDGITHWATCPDAKKWRKRAR